MDKTIQDIEHEILPAQDDANVIAFSRLFHQYRDKLYAFVLGLCRNPQQAEDIVQDIFLKVWQNNNGFRDVINFEAYLFRMAHNHCINILKRMAKETSIISRMKEESSFATEEEVSLRESRTIIRNAVDHLPKQQKQVFILSREMGYRQDEISQEMQISVPTVKSHMTQALKYLRAQCKSLLPVAGGSIK